MHVEQETSKADVSAQNSAWSPADGGIIIGHSLLPGALPKAGLDIRRSHALNPESRL